MFVLWVAISNICTEKYQQAPSITNEATTKPTRSAIGS